MRFEQKVRLSPRQTAIAREQKGFAYFSSKSKRVRAEPAKPFARRARTIHEKKWGVPLWNALNTVLLRKTVALARVLCLRLMVMGFAPETPSGVLRAPLNPCGGQRPLVLHE